MNDQATVNETKVSNKLEVGDFTDAIWNNLIEKTGLVFSFSSEYVAVISGNYVLKLVAAIPYLANCDEPERYALAHMGTFILAGHEATRSAFAHNFKDSVDLKRRLETISYFSSGDERIIKWGMNLLTIAMINDHMNDAKDDLAEGKMNPVNAGHWDADTLIMKLKEDLSEISHNQLETLMIGVEEQTFWAK